MGPLRWGILSAGKISHDFMIGMAVLPKEEHQAVAVSARSLDSAKAFAKTHEIPTFYGSYDELVKNPEIDVVYVGSINTQHLPLVKLALNNGKHVLCEKPLAMNVKETSKMLELAKSRNLFLMEAIWSRFFPVYQELRKRLDNGDLGDVLQVLVTFGEPISDVERLKLKELGGGTVLDLGVYCVQFADFVFGEKPLKIITGGHMNEDGVDESTSTTLVYSNGRTATLVRSPFFCPTEIEEVGGKVQSFPLPTEKMKCEFENATGLHYECKEVRKCILEGAIESPIMSHSNSLRIAEIMESMRKQVGVVYPQDD